MGNQAQTISYLCGSKYVGDVSNHVPHGKGVLHIHKDSPSFKCLTNKLCLDSNNSAVIEVVYQNGKLHKCKINLKNGLTYEGLLDQNQSFNGQGKLTDQQQVLYEGTFQNGKLLRGKISNSKAPAQNQIAYVCQTQGQFIGTSIINGPSTFHNITQNYVASGDFDKGKISKGFYIFPNADHYEGEFSQGVPNGAGTYKNPSYLLLNQTPQNSPIHSNPIAFQFIQNINANHKNSIYFSFSGNFQNGNPNGKGEITFSNGDCHKGRFKDGQIHGQGQYRFADGTLYKGGFYCGSMNGDCTIQFNQKSAINANKKKHEILEKYEGQVTNGIFHGLGILYYGNGVIFKGYFLDGAKNGPGVLIFCQNKYKCLYVMNKLVGQLKLIVDS